MKFIYGLVATALLAVCNAEMKFEEFAVQYKKSYGSSELARRRSFFQQSLDEISVINAQNTTWKAGINEYSDMSWEEFSHAYLIQEPQDCSATAVGHKLTGKAIPDEVDWRTKGVVTPVKNQGQCGSCWTFSTTGAVESAHAIAHGDLPILSEQQLIDCAGAFDNNGCDGGLPSHAFQYIMYNGGLDTEQTYAYEAADGACRFVTGGVGAKLKNEVNITEGSESELTDAIANVGPVSIAYQVASDFKNYVSGVYSSTICKSGPMDVNHAVLAVGYGMEDQKTPYYLVKNSWGTSFGIDGYFKIIRGQNMCGVATCASYPVSA